MSEHAYLIALGSNRRHVRFGAPEEIIDLAIWAIADALGDVLARSRTVSSAPVGPSQRRYANAAVLVESDLAPPEMLEDLQQIEMAMGRERRGQRWSARTLDLDIVLWSGGLFADENLQIPHPRFRQRSFVLEPAAKIAPAWRDPLTGLTLRQLAARFSKPVSGPSRDP